MKAGKRPEIMTCIHDARYWGLTQTARKRYNEIAAGRAEAWQECGECETKCTQTLRIMEELRYAREYLAL